MVSLAFHLLAQLFLLCALMTVVVHSFVADSSLLDCCDLVCVCVCVGGGGGFLPHLMLAGRQPFGFFFNVVSAVLFFHLVLVSLFHGLFCRRHSC